MNNSPYPRFKVAGKTYPDAQSAAKAFHDLDSKGSYTGAAQVETDDRKAFELGGVNAAGEKYLNHLYFQHDPMMKAFKSAYEQILNPNLEVTSAQSKPSTQQQKIDPVAPKSEFPQLRVGLNTFHDIHSAMEAFKSLPLDKAMTGAVRIHVSEERAIEVAGINGEGQHYFNQTHHQDNPLLKAFQEAYKEHATVSIRNVKMDSIAPLEGSPLKDTLRQLNQANDRHQIAEKSF